MDASENPELHKLIRTSIKSGDTETLIKILDKNRESVKMISVFGTWLHVAASFGRIEILKILIEKYGLDVNQRSGVSGGSALNRAASRAHYDAVKYLLEMGAKMDTSEPERNPLFGAILGGDIAVGKLLIKKGIDTKVRYTGESMKDMSALEFAKERGAEEFIKLLGG